MVNPEDGAIEFGTSGKLYNSNLVMYDRSTFTFWSQLDGLGILGELTGWQLRAVSIDTVTWGEWKAENPESEVLNQVTGYSRPYGAEPYGGYYESDFLLFPVENEDDRIHAKTVVFGVEINNTFKAYKEADIKESNVIEDTVDDVSIRVELQDDGGVAVTNIGTGDSIVVGRVFWFAWYAFHPDTLLYSAQI